MNEPVHTEPCAVVQTQKEVHRREMRREIVDFLKMVFWFLVIFCVFRTYVIEGYEVQGSSMAPTLADRERILVLKLPHLMSQWGLMPGGSAIDNGNIVVLRSPDESNKRYIKRVLAKGAPRLRRGAAAAAHPDGETSLVPTVRVIIRDGYVYVDGERVREEHAEAKPGTGIAGEALLLPGDYYVLGDNRAVSKDSRSFGPIEDDKIIGRAVFRFWPLSRVAFF